MRDMHAMLTNAVGGQAAARRGSRRRGRSKEVVRAVSDVIVLGQNSATKASTETNREEERPHMMKEGHTAGSCTCAAMFTIV